VDKQVKARWEALKKDRSDLQDLLDQPGWPVLQGLIRERQREATGTLKGEKEPQALFQAQGVLRAFENMGGDIEEITNASDETLLAMIEKTEEEEDA
jgi:hypothetical protein